ncbi:MAG: cytochrome P460 family protein [Comamonadaceae bacterium]|nr:cytochrome P460 family protein [Comamonadaceae bacterium]
MIARQRQGDRGGPQRQDQPLARRRRSSAKLVWKNKTLDKCGPGHRAGGLRPCRIHGQGRQEVLDATGGWGFARWLGKDQKPYGKDAELRPGMLGLPHSR